MIDREPPAGRAWIEAEIEAIVPRTPRVVSVLLRAGLPSGMAGQHVDIRLTAEDGYQVERSYSIASRPGIAPIELAIEKLADGEVSPYFHEIAAPGDRIEIRGPIGGHFIWRKEDGGPLLLIGGGSGVAPLVAIARHRAAVAPDVPVLLIYSARTFEDLIFRDELLAADGADTDFSFVAVTTRGPAHRAQDFGRRIDAALLHDVLTRWGHVPRHVYVCGSNLFVEATTQHLIGEGIAAAAIRTERYGGA